MEAKTKNILKIVGAIALVIGAVVVYKKYYKPSENKSNAIGVRKSKIRAAELCYCSNNDGVSGGYFGDCPCAEGYSNEAIS